MAGREAVGGIFFSLSRLQMEQYHYVRPPAVRVSESSRRQQRLGLGLVSRVSCLVFPPPAPARK